MHQPAIDDLLDRARGLHPQEIDLSLGRMWRLLEAVGNPQRALPPVFHVAGTNGKGSTVAILRACLEAAGHRVHVFTSPHLVRTNERIRIAGQLVSDAALVAVLHDVLETNAGAPVTVFELLTVAALLLFARHPAEACILEVGMGGRLDSTNVVDTPLACGIAQLGLDHQAFLGSTLVDIAGEKAGIAKTGVPLLLSRYSVAVTRRISEIAGLAGARLVLRGADWDVASYEGGLHYRDAAGRLSLPLPRLAGAHQVDNAGLAIAMLRHQLRIDVPEAALRAGLGWANWPARLQSVSTGPLAALLPPGARLLLDGGHNGAAARALADHLAEQRARGQPVVLVGGLLTTKSDQDFLKPFARAATSYYAVPIAGHAHHLPTELVATAQTLGLKAYAALDVADALQRVAETCRGGPPPLVLIAGSLYLAGAVLEESGLLPD